MVLPEKKWPAVNLWHSPAGPYVEYVDRKSGGSDVLFGIRLILSLDGFDGSEG